MGVVTLETYMNRGDKLEDFHTSLDMRLDAPVTYEQREMIGRLEQFEAPYLKEKLFTEGQFNSQEEYDTTFKEFKKFVALTQLSDKPLGMTSSKVDKVWHQFILFTPQYHKFCDEFLGGYLHHVPETSYTRGDEGTGPNFLEEYNKIFGEPPEIWMENSYCRPRCSKPNPPICSKPSPPLPRPRCGPR